MAYDTSASGRLRTVTPSNTVEVNCRAIYVGGLGDVAIQGASDAAPVTFKAVPVGTVLPVAAKFIMATGTTATFLVALL